MWVSVRVWERRGLLTCLSNDSLAGYRILAQQLHSSVLWNYFSCSSLHNWWWEVCCQSDCHFLMSKSVFSKFLFSLFISYNFTIMHVSVGFFYCSALVALILPLEVVFSLSGRRFPLRLLFYSISPILLSVSVTHTRYSIQFHILAYFSLVYLLSVWLPYCGLQLSQLITFA